MDPLEIEYDSLDNVPETFRSLYTEQEGKFVLSGINGLKTVKDTTALQTALQKERNDHKAVKDTLKLWGDLKPDEVRSKLDRMQELELAAQGKIDDTKLEQIVNSRLSQKTGPLERQLATLTEERDTFKSEVEKLRNSIISRDRDDTVRSAALEMKVHNTAIDDILLVAERYLERTEDGKFIVKSDVQGITPGLDVKGFMKEMQKLRPHWWPSSEGGGARGGSGGFGGGDNPWSKDSWNLSKQGEIVRSQGMEVANRMAKAAGTSVGGLRPK